MAVTWKWINKTNLLIADSAEAIVTNAASTTTFIPNIILHNTDSSSRTVTLYSVPNNSGAVGTAGAGNQIFKATLTANQTYTLTDVKIILDATNDTVQAVASAANVVTIFVYGAEKT